MIHGCRWPAWAPLTMTPGNTGSRKLPGPFSQVVGSFTRFSVVPWGRKTTLFGDNAA